ncbi:MAG: JAB domain-containing protein [Sphingomicrobium sp.]
MLHRHPRLLAEPLDPIPLVGVAAARRFFEACFAGADRTVETLFVAHLDDRARCIHLSRHKGDGTGADLPLRAILIDAAEQDSKGIVLAHNHPSGDPTPSRSDRHATRRLAQVSEAIDLTLVDHLVFGGGECTSFRRLGLL